MARITIVPSDLLILIDGQAAQPIDFNGADPAVHAVQWYGASGWVEYVYDPINNVKPPNTEITNLVVWQPYIDQATAIINAYNNPQTFYSTVSGNVYGGQIYGLGQPIVIDTPNTPQPANTTTVVPPTPESWQDLYWYAGTWVISSVDPTYSLLQAQSYLIQQAKTSGALNVDGQSRIYSTLQLVTDADPSALPSADYTGLTLGDYQTYIDSEVASFTVQVNSATLVPQLYNLNPTIDPDPN